MLSNCVTTVTLQFNCNVARQCGYGVEALNDKSINGGRAIFTNYFVLVIVLMMSVEYLMLTHPMTGKHVEPIVK